MKATKILIILVLALGLTLCVAKVSEAVDMGTAFTYQGRLIDANKQADGLYDFQFKLFDDPNVILGNQVGTDINKPNVDVIDGYFTVLLDFGSSVFDGNVVWLEVGVRPGDQNDLNVYNALLPRQEITAVPYALQTRGIFMDPDGNVGIGTTSPAEKLTVRGNLLIESSDGTDIVELGEGLDYAEGFDVSESTKIGAGSVLIIDPENPGKLALSSKPYDIKVAGIVAGAKGIGSGVRLGAEQFDYDVALAGRVYCNVDATDAAVQPGDLLTTSATRGYAMKAADYIRSQGAILGKAMQKLEKGKKGQILVLVTLQ